MKLQTEIEIEIPRVPNFIMIKSPKSDEKISIADLTTEQLEMIAREWTKNLIKHSKELKSHRDNVK